MMSYKGGGGLGFLGYMLYSSQSFGRSLVMMHYNRRGLVM